MSNSRENNSSPPNPPEQRNVVNTANKLWKSVRNIFERQPSEERRSLGSLILEANKDVSKFGRKALWKGDYADFMGNNKEVPISVITRQLNGNSDFAFRSVSRKEFENIFASNGIGGEDYKGTVIE